MGVSAPKERDELISRLYDATARHFREIRVVEIQKMSRRQVGRQAFSVHDLAADIWDAARLEEVTPLAEWISQRPESDSAVTIPEERPAVLKLNPLFGEAAVCFGKAGRRRVECQSAEQAKLAARLASLGVSGDVKIPVSNEACSRVLVLVNARMDAARGRFQELAASRTGDEAVRGSCSLR